MHPGAHYQTINGRRMFARSANLRTGPALTTVVSSPAAPTVGTELARALPWSGIALGLIALVSFRVTAHFPEAADAYASSVRAARQSMTPRGLVYIVGIAVVAFGLNAIATSLHRTSQQHQDATLALADLHRTVSERGDLDAVIVSRLELPNETIDRLNVNAASEEGLLRRLEQISPSLSAGLRAEAQRHAQVESELIERIKAGQRAEARAFLATTPCRPRHSRVR